MVCGVAPGSIFGPLVFLLYVNDIHKSSKEFTFYLFADDASLTYANDNLRTIELTVNNELQKVNEWLDANKLTLNVKKSNYVITSLFVRARKQYLFFFKLRFLIELQTVE